MQGRNIFGPSCPPPPFFIVLQNLGGTTELWWILREVLWFCCVLHPYKHKVSLGLQLYCQTFQDNFRNSAMLSEVSVNCIDSCVNLVIQLFSSNTLTMPECFSLCFCNLPFLLTSKPLHAFTKEKHVGWLCVRDVQRYDAPLHMTHLNPCSVRHDSFVSNAVALVIDPILTHCSCGSDSRIYTKNIKQQTHNTHLKSHEKKAVQCSLKCI